MSDDVCFVCYFVLESVSARRGGADGGDGDDGDDLANLEMQIGSRSDADESARDRTLFGSCFLFGREGCVYIQSLSREGQLFQMEL